MPWRTSTTASTATTIVGSRPTTGEEWAQIELPAPARIARVVISRDRNGQFSDRQILEAEVRLSSDGQTWQTAATLTRAASAAAPAACPR